MNKQCTQNVMSNSIKNMYHRAGIFFARISTLKVCRVFVCIYIYTPLEVYIYKTYIEILYIYIYIYSGVEINKSYFTTSSFTYVYNYQVNKEK